MVFQQHLTQPRGIVNADAQATVGDVKGDLLLGQPLSGRFHRNIIYWALRNRTRLFER